MSENKLYDDIYGFRARQKLEGICADENIESQFNIKAQVDDYILSHQLSHSFNEHLVDKIAKKNAICSILAHLKPIYSAALNHFSNLLFTVPV